MVPNKNPEKFVEKYGQKWFLREFDFLPERLEFYNRNLSKDAINEIQRGVNWKVFDNLEEAKKASDAARVAVGLKPYFSYLEQLKKAGRYDV